MTAAPCASALDQYYGCTTLVIRQSIKSTSYCTGVPGYRLFRTGYRRYLYYYDTIDSTRVSIIITAGCLWADTWTHPQVRE